MDIVYRCLVCRKAASEDNVSMICSCGGSLKGEGFPSITGTRDGFGIGQNFIDERTGKEITTWKEWEKAGYREPNPKNPKIRELVKEKRKELSGKHLRQPLPNELPA